MMHSIRQPLIALVMIGAMMTSLCAQQAITVDKIWRDGLFYANYVPQFEFMKSGSQYVMNQQGSIMAVDLLGESEAEPIFTTDMVAEGTIDGIVQDYIFSEDEQHLLLGTHIEKIYRHSKRGVYYLYDRESRSVRAIADGAMVMYPTLSPDNAHIAYVKHNDLYLERVSDAHTTRVTTDGSQNAIINGAADWVYEEEFTMDRAYEWNSEGNKLAYLRYDEREVPTFTMAQYSNALYPSYYSFKYPKVGSNNAVVSTHIYDLDKAATVDVHLPDGIEYVPRITWTHDPKRLVVTVLNRHQNHLQLLSVDAKNGEAYPLLTEKSDYYVDIHDHLFFLPDGKHFIWASERSGFNHLYLHDIKGKRAPKPITQGDFDVTDYYGWDKELDAIYYQAAKKSSTQREVYMTSLRDGSTTRVSIDDGYNSAQFSGSMGHYVLKHSTINTPPTHTIYDRRGQRIKVIEDNAELADIQESHGCNHVELTTVPTDDGVLLNTYLIKPENFDPSKQYPLFMYMYGGPGNQQVTDQWRGQNYWWFQMLADLGVVVACVDNRGTGGRGTHFKKMTYLQMGHYETIDQINAAKHLGAMSYIDSDRIGVFGWSYGGYLSSLCMFKGADVFRAGIAVAPVTNWKWYDTIYTERFMRTYEENAKGYDENSPIYFADQLEGAFLLVHGGADDNVHAQHSIELSRALIEANKQFDFYLYPNDNHGIYFKNARQHLYTKMTSFIQEHLL